ncbi:RagB/SusD family nutrient uptake outer membrane protein [Elizabethkingia argentiflava]|uniref:RagB/SusD family nutrient uptake outer membrane protein n=1 Tax=Elizabethkingia argenteiflava TaxID=2681556 RepID=A0A845PW34_9FLAO|nr:RagB/SusD family nutrient uptake outer membrane protein [Elizabethkingia argenteiflava]NAW52044.1 RagB/SusD family nutrient uptake outer membrane protein [Elizabethkingia argenteiflava]
MKKIKYILLLNVVISSLISCDRELDTAPTDSATEKEVFSTLETTESLINGTWAKFNEEASTYANIGYSTVLRTSDAMGSDVVVNTARYGFGSAYAFAEMSHKTQTRVDFIWSLLYSTINNMNTLLSHIDQIEGPKAKKDQVKGQAKAFRAFCYLNLVSFYQFSYLKDKKALVVPIYTEQSIIHTVPIKKSSLEEVYNQIKSDLLDAQRLLKNYERNNKEKINLSVVNGLLARTYLNTGEWLKAAASAQAARVGYALMTAEKYLAGFNDISNEEWIWGHGQIQQQSSESYAFHYLDVSTSGSYYRSFMADPYFKDLFDDKDIRNKLFEWDHLRGSEGMLRYKKFRFKPGLIADIVYMRSAEMYLIEAEANARAGNLAKAVSLLNELKSARKANVYKEGLGSDAVIKEILIERRKELFGEGFSLSDIIRTQGSVKRKPYVDNAGKPIKIDIKFLEGGKEKILKVNAKGHSIFTFPDKTDFVPNSRYYLFSIPQDEADNNTNL